MVLFTWCGATRVDSKHMGSYAVGSDGGGVADVKAHLLRLTSFLVHICLIILHRLSYSFTQGIFIECVLFVKECAI